MNATVRITISPDCSPKVSSPVDLQFSEEFYTVCNIDYWIQGCCILPSHNRYVDVEGWFFPSRLLFSNVSRRYADVVSKMGGFPYISVFGDDEGV